jgi:hypothetical protein
VRDGDEPAEGHAAHQRSCWWAEEQVPDKPRRDVSSLPEPRPIARDLRRSEPFAPTAQKQSMLVKPCRRRPRWEGGSCLQRGRLIDLLLRGAVASSTPPQLRSGATCFQLDSMVVDGLRLPGLLLGAANPPAPLRQVISSQPPISFREHTPRLEVVVLDARTDRTSTPVPLSTTKGPALAVGFTLFASTPRERLWLAWCTFSGRQAGGRRVGTAGSSSAPSGLATVWRFSAWGGCLHRLLVDGERPA